MVRLRRLDREPHLQRLRLALGGDWLHRLVTDPLARASVGLLAHHDAPGGCGMLQPGGGVDDISRHHRLTTLGARSERHQRLTGVEGHAHVQLHGSVVGIRLVDRLADRQRSTHGPLRIIAEGDRRPEDAHHRIPDELLDDTSERLDLTADSFVIRGEDPAHVLWIQQLGAGRELDQIDEDDRHDPPLFPRSRDVQRQTAATGQAESGLGGVVLRAVLANGQKHRLLPCRVGYPGPAVSEYLTDQVRCGDYGAPKEDRLPLVRRVASGRRAARTRRATRSARRSSLRSRPSRSASTGRSSAFTTSHGSSRPRSRC